MKVLFATGHPAQIHNFRNVKTILESHGHEVLWAASRKDISDYLLKAYNIEYTELKRPSKGILSKIYILVSNTWIIFKLIRKEHVDFVISRINPAVVLAAWLLRKHQIVMTDTEAAGFYDAFFCKFADTLLTATSFEKQLRKDQIRCKANIELFYLHPNYFKPMPEDAYRLLGLEKETPYVIVRFISWQAFHDKGHTGISFENKLKAIREMVKYEKVFISAEGDSLPAELEEYRIKIPFEKIHIVLNEATLFLGEGASMASECAMLGTPAIYVNDLWAGCTNEEERYGLLYSFKTDKDSQEAAILKAVELLNDKDSKSKTLEMQKTFLKEHIDPTAFLVWFIEHYPESKSIMKNNPDYQLNFK